MNNHINKKFFFISLFLHIFIIILFLISNSINNKLNNHFLVYGAHSKKQTIAIFKSMKNKPTTTKWFKKRLEENKKKLMQKKQTLVKKNNPPKKQTPPKEIQQNKITISQNKKVPFKKQNKKIEAKQEDEEELHFNLMGSSNPMLAKYQRNIQSEVERLWHPPIGVPKGTECSLRFFINKQGKVEKFKIKKHSKVLLYDLSIIRVAKRFKFDRFLWNKRFTIDFRQ